MMCQTVLSASAVSKASTDTFCRGKHFPGKISHVEEAVGRRLGEEILLSASY